MELFICKSCESVDDMKMSPKGYDWICTECATGEWHHFFDKEKYNRSKHRCSDIVNRPNDEFGDMEPSFG